MSKISDLSDGGSLQSTDFLVAVRSGGNVKVQADDLTLDTLTVEGTLRVPNNEKLIFGTSSTELEVYYSSGPDVVLMDSPTAPLQLGASQVNIASYGGTNYAVFDSTGVDITGTVTADGLTVDGNALLRGTIVTVESANPLFTLKETDTTDKNTNFRSGAGVFYIRTGDDSNSSFTNRLSIAHNTGDISFYEDTGTTAKFFWDASTERLGVGTSTVNEKLVLGSADSGSNFLQITNSTTTAADGRGFYVGIDANEAARILNRENTDLIFSTNNTTQMTLDTSGNLGIGTTSPSESLETTGNIQIKYAGSNSDPSGARYLYFNNTDTTLVAGQPLGGLSWVNNDASATAGEAAYVKAYATTNTGRAELRFGTGDQNAPAEAMRIDPSGNLLVGTTTAQATSSTFAGLTQFPTGISIQKRDAGVVGYYDRLNGDGAIHQFQSDGVAVGSIGSRGGDLWIGTGVAGMRFIDADPSLAPLNLNTIGITDNTIDIGRPTGRWKDIYIGGGLYVGGTGTANKLDDYEEGTFTASLRGTSEPATLLTSSSTYRKIGATVHFCIAFELVTTTGYSGNVEITGLPFAHITGRRSVVNIAMFNDGVWSSGEQLVGIVTSGATNVQFYRLRSANSWQRVQFHTAGSSRYFWATGTYTTTS